MLGLVIGILIGFAGGYLIRECTSRRRRAVARQRMREKKLQLFYRKHPDIDNPMYPNRLGRFRIGRVVGVIDNQDEAPSGDTLPGKWR